MVQSFNNKEYCHFTSKDNPWLINKTQNMMMYNTFKKKCIMHESISISCEIKDTHKYVIFSSYFMYVKQILTLKAVSFYVKKNLNAIVNYLQPAFNRYDVNDQRKYIPSEQTTLRRRQEL